ncbi:hypothetical protein FPZ43_00210 [Mucilaginibacter pallidiroseus]|uniref:DUF5666 domain-containing protein n=1 Tax=Mucilaginibacter pallidiroseus TaxID=2599295 RepID=A0A563UHX2_9SPHI|nr:hypothetical protein [Mucilaginibacter pallidiroseus]TWR30941.1 hypothetical protein FPZ43_00210 [Mucilaginibacter pallidiroseus]
MKNQIKKMSLLAAMLLTGSAIYAQNAKTGAVPPTPPTFHAALPPTPPKDHPAPRGRNSRNVPQQGLKVITTISGKVIAYVANDRNIYDSFNLQSGSKMVNVKFPDHLGSQLMRDAKKGENVVVNGFSQTDPSGVAVFHLVSATASGNQITDAPPAAPAKTNAPELKNHESTISSFQKNAEGNVNGIVLNSKEIVETPPHIMEQLQGILKVGQKISLTGFKFMPPSGVVMASSNTVIRPQTITAGGQTYLVR